MKKDNKKNSRKSGLSFPIDIIPINPLSARKADLAALREGFLSKRRADSSKSPRQLNPELSDIERKKKYQVILTPSVLFYTPEDCLQQAKKGRLSTDKDKQLFKQSTYLFVYWLSRMDPRQLAILSAYSINDYHADPFNFSSLSSHKSYGYGVRSYQVLQTLKFESIQPLLKKGIGAEEQLAIFWSNLSDEERKKLVMEELKEVNNLLRPMWCQCNYCRHRRIGMPELYNQLMRAYCEDLERFINDSNSVSNGSVPKSRRWLYRSVSLVSLSIQKARGRQVFDIIDAFAGLRFTDRPIKSDREGEPDEGYIEYSSEDEDIDCLEGEADEHLDLSDDDELLSTVDGDLAIDEAELLGPISAMTIRKSFIHNDASCYDEEKMIEEGKYVYELFVSELFHHRLITAFWMEETKRVQEMVLREEEEQERRKKEKLANKQNKKKKTKEPVSVPTNVYIAEEIVDSTNAIEEEVPITIIDNETIKEPASQSDEDPLDEILDLGLKELSMSCVDAPPGFDAGFPGVPPVCSNDEIRSSSDPYNPLTSSPFGPSILRCLFL